MVLTLLRRAIAWACVHAAPERVSFEQGYDHAAGELLRGMGPGKPDDTPFGMGMRAACEAWHNHTASTATATHVTALKTLHEARYRRLAAMRNGGTLNPSF